MLQQSTKGYGRHRSVTLKRIGIRRALAILAIFGFAMIAVPAHAGVLIANFEDNTTDGFASLTNSGVQPWVSPVAGATIVPASGPLAGAGNHALELTGSASFNFGQASGGALGYDILGNNHRADFLANNQIEFDWEPVPNGGSGGFSQLYNIILNSQGGGFTNVDGYGNGNANDNQFYFTGYTGNLHHVVVNYQSYLNTVLASANPDGGSFIQFGIQPNAGGGAPADMYFDNFQFSTAVTPEPSSLALLGFAALGVLRRGRRA